MLAHAGEIGIKSKTTRKFMIKQLYRNITKKLPDYNLNFKNISNRTIINSDQAETLAETIADTIFGISYTAPIYLFKWSDLDQLKATFISFASQFMAAGKSFGFDARTTGKNRPHSQSLKVDLGSLLYEAFNGSIKVDLTNPDFYFTVEVREEYAWIYFKTYRGYDGFPQGAQKGILFGIIRDWILDYTAVFLAMKRGVNVRPIRFITKAEDQSDDMKSWHDQFIAKFSFKSCIDIPIYDLLAQWQKLFNSNLCSACMFFSEQLLANASSEKFAHGFVSGVKLDSLQGDITSAGLKWLEENIKTFKIRPNIVQVDDDITTNNFFRTFPSTGSCCTFQNKRLISYNLNQKEKELILEKVSEYQDKYFESYLDINEAK